MLSLRRLIARLPIDTYLLALMATLGLAILFPARSPAAAALAKEAAYAAVFFLFLLYGARLSPAAIWGGLSNWRLQGIVFLSTFALFPLFGLAIGYGAGALLPANLAAGLIFLSLLPSTVQSSIAFTSEAGGDVPAALCSASISNLLGVVLTPILASLVFPGRHALNASGITDIALEILLPFALGQMVRPWTAAFLHRHPVLTRLVDRGSILVVVYAAFSEGAAAGIWRAISAVDLGVVFALDLAMLVAVLLITTWTSRRLGFSRREEIAIVFCGSKKSMASGLPIATILFPGRATGLIVLPLMIFHQTQLVVCAWLARRYAATTPIEPVALTDTPARP